MLKYFKTIKMNFERNIFPNKKFDNHLEKLASTPKNSFNPDTNDEIKINISNNSYNMKLQNLKKWPSEIIFENTYLKNLFSIEVSNPKKSQITPKANYCLVHPTPLNNVHLISLSKRCADFLGINYPKENYKSEEDEHIKAKREEFEKFFSGSLIFPNMKTSSHCYVGHQFGVFAGQLGDGRAISLGDFYNSVNNLFEIQLKGSGLTPYSRFADGRAVLRSSIREFLASEHLYSLGIPSTRALCIIGSSNEVVRDILYNGNPKNEKCAVVTRVAPSFMRFGSFEIFKDIDKYSGHSGPSVGLEKDMLPKMLEYLIKFHYRELEDCFLKREDNNIKCDTNSESIKEKEIEKYKILFELICERTALLVAYWQCYGFTHGVLNTDNMSILGLTIDYGPFGFLEFYDDFYVPNHSDKYGRYCFSEQPNICKWNLRKLAEGLDSYLPKEVSFKILDVRYKSKYDEFYYKIKINKLGLFFSESINPETTDLVNKTIKLLKNYGFDLTYFFRQLAEINKIIINELENIKYDSIENLKSKFNSDEKIEAICSAFIENLLSYSLPFQLRTRNNKLTLNPKALLNLERFMQEDPEILYSFGLDPEMVSEQLRRRTEIETFNKNFPSKTSYEIQKSEDLLIYLKIYIQKTFDEYNLFLNNLDNLKNHKFTEYERKNNFTNYSFLANDVYLNLIKNTRIYFYNELENLATQFKNEEYLDKTYLEKFLTIKCNSMNKLNPKFILRNYMAQEVIEQSEQGNYVNLNNLLEVLMTPFDEHEELDYHKFYSPNIEKAFNICISCSS